MTLPNGRTVKCDELYEDCPIQMCEHVFLADLSKFKLTFFVVILRMDWLAKYQTQINYPKQQITLRRPNREKIVDKGKVSKGG